MELNAMFKPSGRPRNPNKERQLKERLYFNCNKPGHMARDCKQPKKGNGGRKFGKQLNATFVNKPDWGVNGDSTLEGESTDREEYQPRERELTKSQKLRLKEFEEDASELLYKDMLPGVVEVYRKNLLKRGADGAIPVPPPPVGWQGTPQDWEVAVRAMRCRLGYLHRQELRGANHTLKEATMWLKYKLAEYDAQDEQQEDTRGPEPWELRVDQAAMDYEPTDKDVAQLEDLMIDAKLDGNKDRKELEKRNAAETDHPWHNYIP
jgi:hypothetical protein